MTALNNEAESAAAAEGQILGALRHGAQQVTLHGPASSHLAYLLARLAHDCAGRPLLIVADQEEHAQALTRDLTFFLGEAEHPALALPRAMGIAGLDTSPYAEITTDRGPVLSRLGSLYRLAASAERSAAESALRPLVTVCSAGSLRRRVVPPQVFRAHCISIVVDEQVDRESTIARLHAAGYERCPVVDDPGTFSARGGILDVFPAACRYPARIELFGDLVESIRLFDPATQRTLRKIPSVTAHPVRETLRSDAIDPRQRLLALADQLHYPTRSARGLLEEIDSGRPFLGLEALAPAFFDQLAPLWTYLPPNTLWVVVDTAAVIQCLDDEDRRSEHAYHARIEDGRLAFAVTEFFFRAREIREHVAGQQRVEVKTTDDAGSDSVIRLSAADNADLVAELKRARSERGEEILTALTRRLEQWTAAARSVVIAGGGMAQVDKLDALLRTHDVTAAVRRETGTPALLANKLAVGVHLQVGELGRGFRVPDGLVVLSHQEIFGRKSTRRPPRRSIGPRLGDLRELSTGDLVVHNDHGVGRYQGLVQLRVSGIPADFLLLEYASGDRLYLPVHRMNQVQRYVGADGTGPKLDKLGGTTWQRKKRKVAVDVRQFGEELLQLYAQRAALSGFAHDPPGAEFGEFEAGFAFNETPDQLQAISDVVDDLTSDRPMDRLVCGDVGFGKTEVALRAAFVAAMGGQQVGFLAPTTVLVEQHYRTLTERMGPYPLRIEAVSRFRRPSELRPVLADLAAGTVDIVVGTHRLLSADVRFRNLGLLIIDEEQRFGVKHKEWLKRLRTQVDVLAMTATPIPRTLQLSMAGLREISVISTPPADRLAIRTVVSRFDDAMVAEAARKELARGGQVFFVHNEVRTIGKWAERIATLLPEGKIGVAHGQMDARRLERVMFDFVAGRYDVLACTSIIESGLDIPRVNTMFVNRADRFGLSQLYQLRGRIGRSHLRGYCYLLVPGIERMTGEARQRLQLLQQFTQLGSGFSIASYDLELRGAGDLLGARQSGHIAAVGFETYARILEESVAELKGEPIVRETDPDLNVRLPAFLPDDYVEDTGQRLELYKRLSDACRDEGAIYEIYEEIRDRHGPPPPQVETLCELMAVKGLASKLGAQALDLSTQRLQLTLTEATPLTPEAVTKLIAAKDSAFRLRPDNRLLYQLPSSAETQQLAAAKQVLLQLLSLSNTPAST